MLDAETSYWQLMGGFAKTARVSDQVTGSLQADLCTEFPLICDHHVQWTAVKEELLWALRGDPDTATLYAATSPVFLERWVYKGYVREMIAKRPEPQDGLPHAGGFYGFQWRHFGISETAPIGSQSGFDQLGDLLARLRSPDDGREFSLRSGSPYENYRFMSPENYEILKGLYEVMRVTFTRRGVFLNSSVTQEGVELLREVPFNLASHALLLTIVAQLTGHIPGVLTYSFKSPKLSRENIIALRASIPRAPRGFVFRCQPLTVDAVSLAELKVSDWGITYCALDSSPVKQQEISSCDRDELMGFELISHGEAADNFDVIVYPPDEEE